MIEEREKRLKGESIGERYVIGDKKKMRRTQKFLEKQCKKGASLELHVGAGES